MIMTLFKKECTQILKSLIFWLYVACLIFFFNSQMGNSTVLNPPQEGQENYYNYGFKTDITEQDVMETGVGTLAYAYYYDHYVTYPVGYAKNVRISEAEKQEIADIIYDLTGVKADEIEDNIASFF